MIIHVFGEAKSKWEKYTGNEGLKNTVAKLKIFKEKYHRVPKVREKGLSGIKGAVYRGEWQIYGVSNWNELLLYAFREVNLSKNKYKGKSGLEKVAEILRDFKEKYNKIPRTTDKEMNNIRKALYRGEWTGFGIKSWRNLLNYTFGE